MSSWNRCLLAAKCQGGYQGQSRVDTKHIGSGSFPENRKEFVLFCDNLSSQVSDQFLEAAKNINDNVWFGVRGATDISQPADWGTERILKQFVSRIQDNIDLWLTTTWCQTPLYFDNTLGW